MNPPSTILERIGGNLVRIREQITAAATKAGRNPREITLVAVTKSVGLDEIRALLSLGIRAFAENRYQPAQPKIEALASEMASAGAHWHMIGHLQTNKVKQVLQLFQAVDAVDTIRLLECLAKEARKLELKPIPCLAEINVSGEAQKYGLKPAELAPFLARAAELPEIDLRGLMTMAPYADTPAQVETVSRPVFRGLKQLFEEANQRGWYSRKLTELSMGMSNDFRIAVEEGATTVRIGTALFA